MYFFCHIIMIVKYHVLKYRFDIQTVMLNLVIWASYFTSISWKNIYIKVCFIFVLLIAQQSTKIKCWSGKESCFTAHNVKLKSIYTGLTLILTLLQNLTQLTVKLRATNGEKGRIFRYIQLLPWKFSCWRSCVRLVLLSLRTWWWYCTGKNTNVSELFSFFFLICCLYQ